VTVTPPLDYCEHGYCETEHCRTCEIMGVCKACQARSATQRHDYRGVRILVYPQPDRWWFKWNASTDSDYRYGDPFDSHTPEQALVKAQQEIDRCAEVERREEERYRLLYPESSPPPRIYADV
jgi:hypothetical protein